MYPVNLRKAAASCQPVHPHNGEGRFIVNIRSNVARALRTSIAAFAAAEEELRTLSVMLANVHPRKAVTVNLLVVGA